MKITQSMFAAALAVAGLLAGGVAAKADSYPLSLALDAPYQVGAGGETLTFNVDITNLDPSDTVYINADSSNIDAPLTLDDTGFYTNAPYWLDPSADSGDFELFTVFVPDGTPIGLYTGSFQLIGGDPSDYSDTIGSVNFDVYVTPEPASLVLLATGLLGLALLAGRRFSSDRL